MPRNCVSAAATGVPAARLLEVYDLLVLALDASEMRSCHTQSEREARSYMRAALRHVRRLLGSEGGAPMADGAPFDDELHGLTFDASVVAPNELREFLGLVAPLNPEIKLALLEILHEVEARSEARARAHIRSCRECDERGYFCASCAAAYNKARRRALRAEQIDKPKAEPRKSSGSAPLRATPTAQELARPLATLAAARRRPKG